MNGIALITCTHKSHKSINLPKSCMPHPNGQHCAHAVYLNHRLYLFIVRSASQPVLVSASTCVSACVCRKLNVDMFRCRRLLNSIGIRSSSVLVVHEISIWKKKYMRTNELPSIALSGTVNYICIQRVEHIHNSNANHEFDRSKRCYLIHVVQLTSRAHHLFAAEIVYTILWQRWQPNVLTPQTDDTSYKPQKYLPFLTCAHRRFGRRRCRRRRTRTSHHFRYMYIYICDMQFGCCRGQCLIAILHAFCG